MRLFALFAAALLMASPASHAAPSRSKSRAAPPSTSSGGAPSACLTSFPSPAALTTPVRDLTRVQARDIVIWLHKEGKIRLQQAPRFDASCRVTSPTPSGRVKLDITVDGVRYLYLSGRRTVAQPRIDNLDVRGAVLVARLAAQLKQDFGATEIHHMGIGHGNAAHPLDCHNTGRAMDFGGAAGEKDGVPWRAHVVTDWSAKPVDAALRGTRANLYRAGAHPTYRLRSAGGVVPAVFESVYRFATQNAQDTTDRRGRNGTPTTIGASSKFIIHPDHPDTRLRSQHQDHIHFNIGPTGEERSPP